MKRAHRRPSPLIAAGLLVGLALLPLASCRKKPTAEAPAPADAELVAAYRPALPARGAGLAALPVFAAAGTPLKVAQTQPVDGAQGVEVAREGQRIVLQFNHPVVPLVAAEAQESLPVPASIEPALKGKGSWLNTSTWIFEPEEDLRPTTAYRVRVAAGLGDVLGGRLAEAVDVSFSTGGVQVISSFPESGMEDVDPRGPISVTFNVDMDRASAEKAFSLRQERLDGSSDPLPGSFRWAGRTMVFQPDRRLERSSRLEAYRAMVAAGARDARGVAATEEGWGARFTVSPLPRVIGALPRDGDRAATAIRERNAMELRFNAPMDRKGVTVTLQPTITRQAQDWSGDGRELRIQGGWLASQAYTVTVRGTSRSRWGDPLGEDVVIRFTLAEVAPAVYLKTTGPFSVYNAYTPPLAYMDAVNVATASLALHRVSRADLVAMTLGEERWSLREAYKPGPADLVRSWTVDTGADLNAFRRISTTLSAEQGRLMAPGLYELRLLGSGREQDQGTVMLVSTVNLTLKRAEDELLAWATDLRSGRPVAGLALGVWGRVATGDGDPADEDRPQPGLLGGGATDADGVLRLPLPESMDAWEPLLVVSEAEGRVVAAAATDWGEGIEPYAFNVGYDPDRRPFVATAYTDRPVYRAGQSVFYRGVLRADDDARYRLPELREVHVTVRDPQGDLLQERDLPVSEFGTVHAQVDLPAAARLGSYQIALSLPVTERPAGAGSAGGGEEEGEVVATADFRVAAYRKPEYEVEVVTDKPAYQQGETLRATASARYYFGGPVAGAPATWRLIRDDYFFSPEGMDGWWSFIDDDLTEDRYHDAQAEVVSSGEGRTDAEGRFAFALPADLGEQPLSQVFTVEAEITDPSHRVVAARNAAVVHKASLYVGLQAKDYVGTVGEELAFDLIGLNPESQPVAGQEVDLRFYQRTWYSAQEQREDGEFYWTSHFTDTLEAESRVKTDAAGRATASFVPKTAGVHRLVALAKDGAGNEARSATYSWVAGGAQSVNWRQENNDRIDLVADKKAYVPGEVAEILVPAPFSGAEALVTIERGGIRDLRRVTLAGNSETLRVAIEPDYAPNVYVSVVLVKGMGPDSPVPQFRLGYTNLAVSTEQKRLDIRVRPDRPEGSYRPQDKVRLGIEVRDHGGAPVRSELSLALVDKALLALADDSSVPLIDAFYGQRMLGVVTSASLTESADRRNQQLPAEKKGGGGGLTESGNVRRLFRDTAYWNGSVVTDAEGRATVDLDLPDNLTTWSLSARGVSGADTLVGAASGEITSTLPLLVRPVLPRFLVAGDTVQLETVVNNRSDQDRSVQVTATAKGLTLASLAPQDLVVPAGGAAKVVWQATVPREGLLPPELPEALGAATVRMAAEGGGLGDAAELTLPVYAFSAPQIVGTAGRLAADQAELTEVIRLPEAIDAGQGGLEVDLSPSLAAAMVDSLRWLEAFPYDCTEQTTSKFLPNVATYLALQRLDLPGARLDKLRKGLEAVLPTQVQRLYNLQNNDGGWGWWQGNSQPWLTAYALHGLRLAREAGVPVSDDAIARATDYLVAGLDRSILASTSSERNARAYALWVLAEADAVPVGRVLALYDQRSSLSVFGLAALALALDRAGGADQADRVKGLVADLGGRATVSATGAFWPEGRTDPATMSSDARATAIAVLALSRLDPANVNLPAAIRWLMAERSEGHWDSTQETAWAVLGLTEAMEATRELEADYRYTVTLNQAELGRGTVGKANVGEALTLRALAKDLRAGQSNPLTIRREGQGLVYYDAHLRLYTPAEKAEPLAEGIVIGRQYFPTDPATLQPAGEATDRFEIGDVVQVKLTLICDEPRHYVAVEDPIPAGFEILDTSLKTASAAAQGVELEQVREDGRDPAEIPWWERGWWSWWVDSQLLDHKAAFFASELPAGTFELSYLIRAQLAGNFLAAPAKAEEMYFPEVFGRSAGGMVTVAGE